MNTTALPSQKQWATDQHGGFTMIELSIVLVIIGLIIGGIVAASSLIHQAQIRATLTQINKLNTVVNTFKDKFGGLPGDIPTYANVGLTAPATNAGVTAAGWVGDGLIGDGVGSGGREVATMFNGEVGAFFYHLYQAQMIQDIYPTPMLQADATAPASPAAISTYMVASPLGQGFFIWVMSGVNMNNLNYLTATYGQFVTSNYFELANVTSISNTGSMTTHGGPGDFKGMMTIDAAGIDSKIDDGIPNSGNVLVVNHTDGALFDVSGANRCDISGTTATSGVYDVAANSTKGECGLAIRAGF